VSWKAQKEEEKERNLMTGRKRRVRLRAVQCSSSWNSDLRTVHRHHGEHCYKDIGAAAVDNRDEAEAVVGEEDH